MHALVCLHGIRRRYGLWRHWTTLSEQPEAGRECLVSDAVEWGCGHHRNACFAFSLALFFVLACIKIGYGGNVCVHFLPSVRPKNKNKSSKDISKRQVKKIFVSIIWWRKMAVQSKTDNHTQMSVLYTYEARALRNIEYIAFLAFRKICGWNIRTMNWYDFPYLWKRKRENNQNRNRCEIAQLPLAKYYTRENTLFGSKRRCRQVDGLKIFHILFNYSWEMRAGGIRPHTRRRRRHNRDCVSEKWVKDYYLLLSEIYFFFILCEICSMAKEKNAIFTY